MKKTSHLIYYIITLATIFGITANATTNHKKISFEITVPFGTDIKKIKASIPELKYNKKIIASWVTDDGCAVYNAIYSTINKKWVDNEKMSFWDENDKRDFFYHLNDKKSTGNVPSKTLSYTDGCGISHRFGTSIAYWAEELDNPNNNENIYNTSTTPNELKLITDFGASICYHDLKGYKDNESANTQASFDVAINNAISIFNKKLSIIPKIMIEPNGDHDYVYMGRNNPTIKSCITQNLGKFLCPFNKEVSLDKKDEPIIRFFGEKIEILLNELEKNRTCPTDKQIWVINGAHRETTNYVSEYLKKVEELYGASGLDCIWFPSIDEYYEYWFMRKNTTISKVIDGNKIRFTLDVPVEDNFYFQSLSLLIDGITSKEGLIVKSDDSTYGTSYGINDNKLLVNLDFNELLPQRVEKYTAIFEKEKTTGAYEDAMYFISQLKPELKDIYIAKVDNLLTPPIISNLSINKGATKVSNNLISINFTASLNSAYYRISESPDFTDSDWLPLNTNFTFQLSPEPGNKTIYLQLKNAVNLSDVKSISVILEQSEKKIVLGLSGDDQINMKEIINGEIINRIKPTIYENWSNVKLYDTSDYPCFNLLKKKSAIEPLMEKYNISGREQRDFSFVQPILTGDKGIYPDRFIQNGYFFGSDTEVTPETRRLTVAFTDVPNGKYDIRILGSRNGATNKEDYVCYRYQANNSIPVVPTSDIFNNNCDKFIEIKNVTVNDNTLLICSWREPYKNRFDCSAPMNLIEIKPAAKSSTSISETKENQTIIYSGKGKLTIENNNNNPFTIYRVDGTIIQKIMPDNKHIEVTLPAGIYIINGKKGIVY